MESKKYTLTKHDLGKIGRGALVAIGGALALYIAGILGAIDWSTIGKYGYLLAPIASIVINTLRKFASQTPTQFE